ncbi:Retinol dehydrogenase 13 [Armadillidium nasatum]|uniref:Retinol dehydrogenase 13 n=1 Tax=Armadillidium nasatum TaxID=96803 RepID=A0A5N5SUW4_9CRUS|nr:Retinol dehydrogenase 13 [Armadillidium nasatum]
MLQILFHVVIGIFSLIFLFGVIYRKISGVCKCKNQLTGKTVIVTGASAGIGKEAAYDFAQRGARVILACRNLEKAERIQDWIVESTGNKDVICRHLELSDLDSVRKFAKETIEKEKRLDVLVNNAGRTVGVKNFLSMDMNLIVKSSPSRIINVSSIAHKFPGFNLEDLHYKNRKYGGMNSYSQSKLCNVLFTNELVRRLAQKGVDNVTVNSLHPGAVKTEIGNKSGKLWMKILGFFLSLLFKTEKLGAQTTIHLAVSDEGEKVTGKYFVDCKIASTSQKAKDKHLAKEVWRISEKEVGLTEEEKYF